MKYTYRNEKMDNLDAGILTAALSLGMSNSEFLKAKLEILGHPDDEGAWISVLKSYVLRLDESKFGSVEFLADALLLAATALQAARDSFITYSPDVAQALVDSESKSQFRIPIPEDDDGKDEQ